MTIVQHSGASQCYYNIKFVYFSLFCPNDLSLISLIRSANNKTTSYSRDSELDKMRYRWVLGISRMCTVTAAEDFSSKLKQLVATEFADAQARI